MCGVVSYASIKQSNRIPYSFPELIIKKWHLESYIQVQLFKYYILTCRLIYFQYCIRRDGYIFKDQFVSEKTPSMHIVGKVKQIYIYVTNIHETQQIIWNIKWAFLGGPMPMGAPHTFLKLLVLSFSIINIHQVNHFKTPDIRTDLILGQNSVVVVLLFQI